MNELEPGFYWIRPSDGDDWEPAAFNGDRWALIGTEVDDEQPYKVGARLSEPTD